MAVRLLIVVFVPESVRYPAAREGSALRVGPILARIEPAMTGRIGGATRFVSMERKLPGIPVANLFTAGRAPGTVALWVPFFIAFAVLIVVVLWTPALLRRAGMTVPDAAFVVAVHGAGGFLGMVQAGYLFDQFGILALVPAFLLGCLFSALLGQVGACVPLAAACDGLIGMRGCRASGVIAMAAVVYPTAICSAGIGWAMGMGRLGQVCAPLLVGALLTAGWTVGGVFLVVAAGPAIAAIATPTARELFAGAAVSGAALRVAAE